ncbi:MAG TPA: aminotransferase class I/II-fold pyridoxal phosphate-dependent enzyme [Bacteroidia bacterium]|nr:aminotransferase class I/II-fold pyridoxal phosphate-dependent enzyme [Bacteroidia bacterium]HNT79900.1 aminotransferase class I/II-fold pyridoxal phosphate-dependent enzyme [Bacteroidia bacterium]
MSEVLKDAKSKHEQVLELIDQVSTIASQLGIAHLTTEDYELDGRKICVNGSDLLNFGSCSYLGLELDYRLKAGAIDAAQRYGTQFSSSRAYVSVTLYSEAEDLFRKIFNKPVILAPTVTLGHLSNIPVLVGDNDAMILDSQVHDCVQMATTLVKARGAHLEVVRHNNMEYLESRIKKLSETHDKVWYMVDGVYSMYGDLCPLKDLEQLMNKYEKFHLYVDDSHGMSWAGKNGSGHVLSQINFHRKLYLVTGLAKAFGAAGGVLVFPDEESRRLVKNCGRTLIFSGPIQPPTLGAIIASARIHLSNEIYDLQRNLQERIKFFNATAKLYDLPLIGESNSPITFIGVGKPAVGYNMIKQLLDLGYYTNLSVFPTVPYKNTGLRSVINVHHTFEDIEIYLKTMAEILPVVLKESDSDISDIYKAFKMTPPQKSK